MANKTHKSVDDLNLSVRKKAKHQHWLKIELEAKAHRELLEQEGAGTAAEVISNKLREVGMILKSLKRVPALQRELLKKAYKIYIPRSSRGRKHLAA